MPKYRQKPVEIEAIQLAPHLSESEFLSFMGDDDFDFDDHSVTISTPEGTMLAQPGDWIIRSVAGLYPCKPDVFEATYEPVLESDNV